MTRRTVLGAGASLVLPWSVSRAASGNAAGFTDTEIILGMSAAFSGPSRGLGIELYRGAYAYFNHVNRAGGIGGRKIVLRT
ncbi:MAG: ABC transporter substrate-binding protein, partial [Gemmatimonadetes bacterium]|nr:ABC transporter substrate-binding protein [Gemmatimonadota bacterium]